jgi:hypothetical protein
MNGRRTFPILSTVGLLLCLGGATKLPAQSASADDELSRWQQVKVDDRCQALSPDTGEMKNDPDICHFDGRGVVLSSHVATREVDGIRQHTRVDVEEKTFLLQDIHADPVVFVVSQKVPDGWRIDSDPQPKSTDGDTAIFRVIAQPGQIVRLHVGMSHETPMDDPQ